MKVQFDHEFQSSFYLFLNNHITHQGGGSGISQGMMFNYYSETSDVYQGLSAFYTPHKQLFVDGVPSGEQEVYIKNGATGDGWYPQNLEADKLLIIDHYDGRVILNSGTYGNPVANPGMTISGNFAQKDFNVYITNESEEQLFVENEFILASDNETYYESISGLNTKRYVVPGVFISLNSSTNDPYAFGGEDNTSENIRLVCVGDSNYNLDGILSLCRDMARQSFPLVPFGDFPFGEFFHVKKTGYAYEDIEEAYSTGKHAYIEEASTSKLFDRSSNKIPKDLRIGFVDVEVSNVRYPRL